MSDDFHKRLHHIAPFGLHEHTAQTDGMTRVEAISGKTVGSEGLWMGETYVAASVSSGDHHHGESETAIYVVSGHPVFVFYDETEGAEKRIETKPGDYVFVPPWVPHREENPDPENPAIVVIARTTQEAIVVNLPSLEPQSLETHGDA